MPRKPDPSKLLQIAEALDLDDLEQLAAKLQKMVDARSQESEAADSTAPQKGRKKKRKNSQPDAPEGEESPVKEEYRKCGKPNCWCYGLTDITQAHGPYYYRSVRDKKGRPRKKYLGKRQAREEQE